MVIDWEWDDPPSPLVDVGPAEWDRRCEARLRDGIARLQAAHAELRARGGGRIVVVVPTIAMTGMAGLAPEAAAAEGLRGLVKAAARQWGADGITVNCVAVAPPGEHRSPVVADPALASPPDVAAVVAMLLSDAAAHVTGATVPADGGLWMLP
jgi:3-oxoacyl-[acyl-carrier protein] reductase